MFNLIRIWNETGTIAQLHFRPHFYETYWFYASCLLCAVAVGASIHRWRVRGLRRQLAWEFNIRSDERISERTRIAREMHDTLLQNFQGLILKFHAGVRQIAREDQSRETLERALDYADEVLAEGRDRIRNLRTPTIAFGGLPKAFRQVVEEAAPNRSSIFKTVVEGTVRELHPIIREETYRIGREALINALTHSEAHNIEVEITYDSRGFRLRIRDDGRGIDPHVLEKGGRDDHWGLQGMRERAHRIGGELHLWSHPGSGTEVELTVPAAIAYRANLVRCSGLNPASQIKKATVRPDGAQGRQQVPVRNNAHCLASPSSERPSFSARVVIRLQNSASI